MMSLLFLVFKKKNVVHRLSLIRDWLALIRLPLASGDRLRAGPARPGVARDGGARGGVADSCR